MIKKKKKKSLICQAKSSSFACTFRKPAFFLPLLSHPSLANTFLLLHQCLPPPPPPLLCHPLHFHCCPHLPAHCSPSSKLTQKNNHPKPKGLQKLNIYTLNHTHNQSLVRIKFPPHLFITALFFILPFF